MRERMWQNEYRTSVVCVDSYRDGVLAGRLYNPGLPQGETFLSLMQFLLKMEDLLDTMRFPQSFTASRGFSREREPTVSAPPSEQGQVGKRATFAVRVLFRQNASWQGSVVWLEGGREESFRSVLELVLLMDSALRAGPEAT